jgi:hypothetical protein
MNHKLINSCIALCLLAAGTVMAGDKAAMIASATSAGPASVTANATVKDSDGNVLKQGSNDFTCYPETEGMGAMCNQGQWDDLIAAVMSKGEFTANQISFSYMLAGEGNALGVSNSDPYQTDPGAVDDWIKEGPHMMIAMPREMLKGMSRNPRDPVYVMWDDTPYAHVMVRIAEEK